MRRDFVVIQCLETSHEIYRSRMAKLSGIDLLSKSPVNVSVISYLPSYPLCDPVTSCVGSFSGADTRWKGPKILSVLSGEIE